jgi:hypothetical protein
VKRILTSVASAAAVALLLAGAPAVANAAEAPAPDISETQLVEIAQRLDALGVTEAAQQGIIEGVKAGKLPDSDIGATPTSTESLTRDGYNVTRYTFADGSVAESSLETPAANAGGGISIMGVGGCRSVSNTSAGSKWLDCKADYNAATWSGSFYMPAIDWTKSSVTLRGNPYNLVQGGIGVSGQKYSVTSRGGNTKNSVGQVRWQANQNINILGIPTSRTVGFDLKVTPAEGPRVFSFGG